MNRDTIVAMSPVAAALRGNGSPFDAAALDADARGATGTSGVGGGGSGKTSDVNGTVLLASNAAVRLDGGKEGEVVTFGDFQDDDDEEPRGSITSDNSDETGAEEGKKHGHSRVLAKLSEVFGIGGYSGAGAHGRAGTGAGAGTGTGTGTGAGAGAGAGGTDAPAAKQLTTGKVRQVSLRSTGSSVKSRLTMGANVLPTGDRVDADELDDEGQYRRNSTDEGGNSVSGSHHMPSSPLSSNGPAGDNHSTRDGGAGNVQGREAEATSTNCDTLREAAEFKNHAATTPLPVRLWSWTVHVAIRLRMAARLYRHSDFTYYMVRLVNGANITPFRRGRSTARRIMQILLLVGCYLDLILWSMALVFGKPSLCPHEVAGEGFQCEGGQATPYLLTLNLVWPGAAFFSIIGGIFVHSSELKVNQIRMYSAWSRLFVIPIALFIFFYFYFNYRGLTSDEKGKTSAFMVEVAAGMVISRLVQIVVTEQYIALVDRIRLTLGWDGLTTAMVQTKDSKRDVQSERNKFQDF
jgi:hypothetical protein